MPTQIGTELGKVVICDATAAEINALATRPYAAVFISGQSSSKVRITSLEFSVFCNNVADNANVIVVPFLQRGLKPDATISIFSQQNFAEFVYFRQFGQLQPLDDSDRYIDPIELQSGVDHTFCLALGTFGAMAGSVRMSVCVRGRYVDPNAGPFPYTLR